MIRGPMTVSGRTDEEHDRRLRRPSFGALFFTQGWALGARLYLWFVLSLIPAVGLVALVILAIYGRRWSWKRGGWASWGEFERRMRLLDLLAGVWVGALVICWLVLRGRM